MSSRQRKTAPSASAGHLTRFVASSGLTNLADGVALVVWAWMATLLTRDPLLIALMPVALRLPWFVFALPAGIVTDRVDRRRLILAMDMVRAGAFAAAAATLAALPLPDPPLDGLAAPGLFAALLASALAVGAAEVFRDNAAQTMMPALVPPEDLERANGKLWSVELVGNVLVGPVIGAFLIAAAVWLPFALNACAFILAALLIPRPPRRRPPAAGTRDWRAELREGWAFLRGSPLLRLLAVVTGAWNLLHQMAMIALVLHVRENFGLGVRAYGLILAAGAVGGIAAGFLAGRISARLGPGTTARWMILFSSLGLAAIPLAPNGWILAAILAVFEFCGVTWNTVSVSHRQRTVPDALLGRVNSIYRLFAWGMMPLGLVLSGLAVRWAGAFVGRPEALLVPFAAAAAGSMLLTLAAWRSLDRLFRARDE